MQVLLGTCINKTCFLINEHQCITWMVSPLEYCIPIIGVFLLTQGFGGLLGYVILLMYVGGWLHNIIKIHNNVMWD